MNHAKEDYCRGDIWLARLSQASGSEMDGTRPFVILQNNVGNYHGPTVIGTPLTTQIKKTHLPTHVILQSGPCAGSIQPSDAAPGGELPQVLRGCEGSPGVQQKSLRELLQPRIRRLRLCGRAG